MKYFTIEIKRKFGVFCSKGWRNFFARILWALRISQVFSIQLEGYKVRFYPTSISCALWVDKKFSVEDRQFFEDFLVKNDVVIDVGANIGHLSLLAASRVGLRGNVFAFEPHPRTYAFLIKNIKLNSYSNIHPFDIALGCVEGSTYLSQPGVADDMACLNKKYVIDGICVKEKRLSDILERYQLQKVNLIKIDTEGYEKFVLQGANRLLPLIECIYFESSERNFNRFRYKSIELFRLIQQAGFLIYHVSPIQKNFRLIPINYTSHKTENLVAIKNVEMFIQRTGYSLREENEYN